MPLRLGKLPAKQDPRTLKLSRYIPRLPQLPDVPPLWSVPVMNGGGYPMFLNDQIGDCVVAGMAHSMQTWSYACTRPLTFTDAQIVGAYSAISGYDPATGENDNGCILLDALKYFRKHGLGGHRIAAFVSIDPRDWKQVRYAQWLFGGVFFGLALPNSVCVGDLVAAPWDDTVTDSPVMANGHCVMLPDLEATVTWGTLKPITQGFFERYCDEAYAILSLDWFNGNLSASGFDLKSLRQDLEAVTCL